MMKLKVDPLVLLIIDGFGIGGDPAVDAIAQAKMPVWRALRERWPHTSLEASGAAVGLPEGQMGNSEVGHLNIGAGQRVPQELPRINTALADGSFSQRPELQRALKLAHAGRLHLMSLLGPGGVHATDQHLIALAEAAHRSGVRSIFVHLFLDGRDTPPRSALAYLADLERRLSTAAPTARIATISGRYFAMDRDQRWERTAAAVAAIVAGEGAHAPCATAAVEVAYARGESDEFVTPTILPTGEGEDPVMRSSDTVIHANFRAGVTVARDFHRMVNAHCRAAESVKRAVRCGVDVIYHCEHADEEALDMLESVKDRVFVGPAIGLLHAAVHEAPGGALRTRCRRRRPARRSCRPACGCGGR